MRPTRLHALGDRRIAVYDDLLDTAEITAINQAVRALQFTPRESFDRELNCALPPDELAKIPRLPGLVEEVFASLKGEFGIVDPTVALFQAYAAAFDATMHALAHTDVTHPQALSFLYYANTAWRASWAGETVFYDGDDALYAVGPRPGRLAVFHSNILHRGGAPHPNYKGYRLTVSHFYYPAEVTEAARAPSAATP